jgi:hypothetical protein
MGFIKNTQRKMAYNLSLPIRILIMICNIGIVSSFFKKEAKFWLFVGNIYVYII